MLEVTSLSAIEHILSHKPERIRRLFLPSGGANRARTGELLQMARAAGITIDTSLPRKGGEGARALLDPFEYADFDAIMSDLSAKPRAVVVALDHLQDPQNFGAICRTAEGFGVDAVLIPKDRSVAVGPGVYSASVGAVETVPVALVGNLSEALRKLKGENFWILGSSLGEGTKTVEETPDFEKAVLVLGAELEGMSPSIEKLCDWLVHIPLAGRVQSLNVSAAGAVLIYELSKRRRGGK